MLTPGAVIAFTCFSAWRATALRSEGVYEPQLRKAKNVEASFESGYNDGVIDEPNLEAGSLDLYYSGEPDIDENSRFLSSVVCQGMTGTGPPDDDMPGGPPGGWTNSVLTNACDGGAKDYKCHAHPGQCNLWCRMPGGTWERVRVEKDVVPGPFQDESCPLVVCNNPQQFCSGSWPGHSNCDSTSDKELTDSCEGSKTDGVSWTFSAEVSTKLSVNVPFCVKGETSVTLGASRTGSTSWQTTFKCNPSMTLKGCNKCSSSGGQCTYSCRVVHISKTTNATLKLRVKVYFQNQKLAEKTCEDSNLGNLQLDITEWAQPEGCVEINDSTSECSESEESGDCKPPTSSPPVMSPTEFPIGLPTPNVPDDPEAPTPFPEPSTSNPPVGFPTTLPIGLPTAVTSPPVYNPPPTYPPVSIVPPTYPPISTPTPLPTYPPIDTATSPPVSVTEPTNSEPPFGSGYSTSYPVNWDHNPFT